MGEYSTAFVTASVRKHFTEFYKTAADFPGTPLFYQAMALIGSADALKEIVDENDRGIPPVQALLRLFMEHGFQPAKPTDDDRRHLGMLLAYVFKNILRYEGQKDNIPVEGNHWGIRTAALYYDRSDFIIVE